MTNKIKNIQAGDILAIGSKTPVGYGISATTLSFYSHIAVAASNSTVYEYIGGVGIVETNITDCFSKAHTVTLFKRPYALNDTQKDTLKSTYEALKNDTKHASYSKLKALYSGLLPISRNIIWILAFGASFWGYHENNTAMYILSGGFLLFTPAISVTQWFCRNILQPWGVKWAQDLGGDFCSSFAIMLDAISGGSLHRKVLKAHEPRPKDVASACKQLNYKKIKLK